MPAAFWNSSCSRLTCSLSVWRTANVMSSRAGCQKIKDVQIIFTVANFLQLQCQSQNISKSNYIFCISIPTPWPDGVVFPLMQPLVEMVPAQRLHVPGHRTKARWRARRPARRPVRWGDRPATSMAWPRPRWYADPSWSNSCHSGRPSKKRTCSWKPTTWTTNRRHEMIGPPSDRDVQCYTSLKPKNPSILYPLLVGINHSCQEKPSFIGIWVCLQFQFLDVAQEFFPHQELIAPKFLTECTFQTLTIDSIDSHDILCACDMHNSIIPLMARLSSGCLCEVRFHTHFQVHVDMNWLVMIGIVFEYVSAVLTKKIRKQIPLGYLSRTDGVKYV